MNEIGLQQVQTAKGRTSAPDAPTGKEFEQKNVKGNALLTASTEVPQTEQRKVFSDAEQKEQMDKQVERAVAKLNDYVQNTERKLEFQVDEDSGQTVVRVYDKNSEELIRQIPDEEALALAQRLNQEEPLMLFSAQV